MTVEEACEVLGVKPDAPKEKIASAFRRAASGVHSDAENGDRATWERVVEARDALLGQGAGTALVPIDLAKELSVTQGRALERAEQRRERVAATKSTLQSVTLRHTSPLDRRKRGAWMAGGLATLLGTITTVIKSLGVDGVGSSEAAAIVVVIIASYLFAGGLTLAGFILKFQAEQLGHAIEDVTAQLSRRANYFELFNEIHSSSALHDEWTLDEFERSIGEWVGVAASRHPSSLAATAREIGSRDFAELVISKGLELGVLSERSYEDDGELFVVHRLRLAEPARE